MTAKIDILAIGEPMVEFNEDRSGPAPLYRPGHGGEAIDKAIASASPATDPIPRMSGLTRSGLKGFAIAASTVVDLAHGEATVLRAGALDPAAAQEIDWLIRLVSEIRAARTELNVPPGARLPLHVRDASPETAGRLARQEAALARLAAELAAFSGEHLRGFREQLAAIFANDRDDRAQGRANERAALAQALDGFKDAFVKDVELLCGAGSVELK